MWQKSKIYNTMYFPRKRYLDKLISHKNNHMVKVVTGMLSFSNYFILCKETYS